MNDRDEQVFTDTNDSNKQVPTNRNSKKQKFLTNMNEKEGKHFTNIEGKNERASTNKNNGDEHNFTRIEIEAERGIPLDRGYSWVIALASAGIFALFAGGFKCHGILLVELIENYEGIYSTSTVVWVLTSKFILTGMLGPVASLVVTKTSHRTAAMLGISLDAIGYIGLAYSHTMTAMILTYSIISGVGSSLGMLVCFQATGPYFRKRKALAVGIMASGSGVGVITIPYIIRSIFDSYHFGGAVLLYSGFTLHFLILASLLRPVSYYLGLRHKQSQSKHSTGIKNVPEIPVLEHGSIVGQKHGTMKELRWNNANTELKENNMFNLRVLLMPKFLMIAASIFVYAFGTMGIFSGMASLAKESGLSKMTTAAMTMSGGALEILSRTLHGLAADKKIISATSQYTLCFIVTAFTSVINSFTPGIAGVVILLLGVYMAGTSMVSLIPSVFCELIGEDNVNTAIGMQMFIQSCAILVYTFMIKVIYEETGSWKEIYYYLAGIMVLGALVTCPYCLYKLRGTKSSEVGCWRLKL